MRIQTDGGSATLSSSARPAAHAQRVGQTGSAGGFPLSPVQARAGFGWVLIDGDGAELLFLEAALKQEGIDAAFDPFRPGEAGGFTRDCAQPVRLMVRQSDLDRAREIVDQARRAEPEPPAT